MGTYNLETLSIVFSAQLGCGFRRGRRSDFFPTITWRSYWKSSLYLHFSLCCDSVRPIGINDGWVHLSDFYWRNILVEVRDGQWELSGSKRYLNSLCHFYIKHRIQLKNKITIHQYKSHFSKHFLCYLSIFFNYTLFVL